MLLETAFDRPPRELRIQADIDSVQDHNTDYYTADRIQRDVSSKLGPGFADVVRKCIQCNFGHGSDLGSRKLQEGFHEDVIHKLEDIEAGLRKLGIWIFSSIIEHIRRCHWFSGQQSQEGGARDQEWETRGSKRELVYARCRD
jgi:hypothetical protein